LEGVVSRVFTDIFTIIQNIISGFHIIKTDDLCYSDDQLIEEYADIWGYMCSNAVIVHGMKPLTWNNGIAQEHIIQSEFKKEKKEYKANHHPLMEWAWGEIKHIFQ